ncbi:MAG: L-Ala-D/L-Glu epimerase [Alphaproteobacteria bacterium]|nr:L-Ala-D/L-Glu epimerase [Alphaproteobacteria bacterium]
MRLSVRREIYPLRAAFAISRGSRTEAHVVVVELEAEGARGRGECLPYARYGETVEGVMAAIEGQRARFAQGLDRLALQKALPPGAARNALDCALWDWEAKRKGTTVAALAGLAPPGPLTTCYTLSLDTPEAMGRAATANAHRPVLKLKVTGEGDLERVASVHANAPMARLVVDANEGWTAEQYARFAPDLARMGVEMIEQPLPAKADAALSGVAHPIPVCADESCHDAASLAHIAGRYEMVNIKLDKTGGLTEALALKRAAEAKGLGIMVGCMIATSLSMAPAMLVAQGARVVDLDGPLLLAADRAPGLRYEGSTVHPPTPELWG